jgi:membrane protease YdiL (CAAX protease family)
MEPDPNEIASSSNAQPSGAYRVFVGEHGIRAGWSVLLFTLLVVLASVILGFILRPLGRTLQHSRQSYFVMGVGEAVLLLSCLFATAVVARIEHRSMWSYGLRGPAQWHRFLSAGAWGFGSLTVLLAGMDIFGHFSPGAIAVRGAAAAWFAIFWLVMFFLVGMAEETLFRGYAQYTLARGMGFWPAAILLACLFGFVHIGNSGENKLGAAAAGLFGLFLAFTLKRTGSLWWAIGFHTLWDYSESFIYSVPDSGQMVTGHLLSSRFTGPAWITGGSVGPEGSYFIFPLLGGLALLFGLTYRKSELSKQDYATVAIAAPAAPLNTLDPPSI